MTGRALARTEPSGNRGHIVVTSIQPPTAQVRVFLRQPGWRTVFVADRKTPDFDPPGELDYLSLAAQQACPWAIARRLPWNHYARKNLGYLMAMQSGASCIFDTDDDNAPVEPWITEPPAGNRLAAAGGQPWVNVYAHFGAGHVWPRGYPLEHIGRCTPPDTEPPDDCDVVVWQGMVEGDPDVDAIFRLTRQDMVEFRPEPALVLPAGSYCPFNSQNTLWQRAAFTYLYLPASVSFRFTDILRGLVAQRCFWAHGWRLGFQSVTAHQTRNSHDLMADFRDEVACYLNVSGVALLLDRLALGRDAAQNIRTCYQALARAAVVAPDELPLLESWLDVMTPGQPKWAVAG